MPSQQSISNPAPIEHDDVDQVHDTDSPTLPGAVKPGTIASRLIGALRLESGLPESFEQHVTRMAHNLATEMKAQQILLRDVPPINLLAKELGSELKERIGEKFSDYRSGAAVPPLVASVEHRIQEDFLKPDRTQSAFHSDQESLMLAATREDLERACLLGVLAACRKFVQDQSVRPVEMALEVLNWISEKRPDADPVKCGMHEILKSLREMYAITKVAVDSCSIYRAPPTAQLLKNELNPLVEKALIVAA